MSVRKSLKVSMMAVLVCLLFSHSSAAEFGDVDKTGATLYEVARSDDPTFQTGCTVTPVVAPATCLSDPAVPPGGAAFHYIVRTLTPNVGSWGVDSEGVERTSVCP